MLAVFFVTGTSVLAAPIPIEAVKRDKPVAFGEVKQILNRNCTACHSASKKESGLSLETRESILKGGNVQGPAVVAAKPDESPLLRFASHSDDPVMPPKDNKVNAKNLTPTELGLIKLWIEQGAQAGGDMDAAKVEFQPLPPGVNPIFAVAISPDGRYAACGRANQVFIYQVATGRVVCRLTDPEILKGGVYKKPGVAHLDLVQALSFSPDGSRLASGGFQEFKLWTRPQNVQAFKAAVAAGASVIAVSPDRKTLAAAVGKDIQLIEAATGKAGKTLSGHAGAVTALRFSADSTQLFSGSADKTVRMWKVADGAALLEFETPQPVAALAIVAGGKQVVTAGGDNAINVWDLAASPVAATAAASTEYDTVALVPASAVGWKYFAAPEKSDLGDRWRAKDFDDKAWKTGKAPLGNGEDEVGKRSGTAIGEVGTSLVLRRAIDVPAELLSKKDVSFQLRVASDDSAAVFVNGQQVEDDPEADHEFKYWNREVTLQAKQFQAGSNVIAVLAKNKAGSSDLFIDLELTARAPKATTDVAKKEDKPQPGFTKLGAIKPVRTLTGHSQPVTSLETIAAAAPNDVQIISGSADGTLRHWNTANGQQVRSMTHGGPVVAVAARPDGQRFVSVSSNNTAKLWNATNGQGVAFNNQQEIKGDFRAQELSTRLNDQLQLANAEITARKAAVDAAKKAAPPKAEGAKKAAEAVTTADKTLKEKQTAADKANGDKTAAEKEVAKAQDAAKVATDKAKAAEEAANKDTKNEGLKKAKADADKALADAKKSVTDAENKVKAAEKPAADATKALNDAQAAFNSAKRASELAAADVKAAEAAIPAAEAALKSMEDRQKKITTDLEAAKKAATASEMPFTAVAFSPDNLEVAIAGADKLIHTYSAETGQPLDVLAGSAAITGLAYLSETTIASLSADNQLIGWNTSPEWTLERTVGGPQHFADRVISLAFSHDGKLLATGGGEPSRSGEIKFWDVATGNLVRALQDPHSDTVFGLEFSPDDTMLASCAADKFVKLHTVADGKWVKSFEGHTHHVLGVSWQANGKVLASCGADQVIKVWNVESGEQTRTIQNFPKQFTALRYVGTTNTIIAANGDGNIHHRTADNGNNVRTYSSGSSDYQYACDVSYGGALIIGGGQDSVLRVWNGTNGQSVRTFEAPKSEAAPGVAASKQ
jgi:WD40 repeat protein